MSLGWTFAPDAPPRWGSSAIKAVPRVIPQPLLFDTKVLLWGAERRSAGEDPLDDAFWGRDHVVYNYPPGWSWLSWLHLDRSDLKSVAWGFVLTFAAAFIFLLPPITPGAVCLHALVLLSPACLNATGQGNGELVVIALVLVAAKLAARPGWFAAALAATSLGVAALLKLYPMIGFAALLRRGRRAWPALVGAVLVLVAFVAMRHDIVAVVQRTPHPAHTAFGCQVLSERAGLVLGAHRSILADHPALRDAVTFLARSGPALRFAALVLIAGVFLIARRRAFSTDGPSAFDPGMALGCLLFLGAFSIGSSWSHRLLALLPCLAAAWQAGRLGLTAFVVAVLWSTAFDQQWLFAVGQVLAWSAAAVLSWELGRIAASAAMPTRGVEWRDLIASWLFSSSACSRSSPQPAVPALSPPPPTT